MTIHLVQSFRTQIFHCHFLLSLVFSVFDVRQYTFYRLRYATSTLRSLCYHIFDACIPQRIQRVQFAVFKEM